MIGRIPRDEDYELLSITYEMIWATLICNIGEEIFGDLDLILPLEGNTIAGQDQLSHYTFHEWSGGQWEVGNDAYHIQISSPPTSYELDVEDDF